MSNQNENQTEEKHTFVGKIVTIDNKIYGEKALGVGVITPSGAELVVFFWYKMQEKYKDLIALEKNLLFKNVTKSFNQKLNVDVYAVRTNSTVTVFYETDALVEAAIESVEEPKPTSKPTITVSDMEDVYGNSTSDYIPTRAVTPTNTAITSWKINETRELTIDDMVAQWHQLMEFDKRILDESDYTIIDGKKRKNKSAFRKYARFYMVADEIKDRKIEIYADGSIYAEFTVVAWRIGLPEDRKTGWGAVYSKDKCKYDQKEDWKNCKPNCNGLKHFKNPRHDVPSTAHTRAKSRAISDLIAGGEVSAEEMM